LRIAVFLLCITLVFGHGLSVQAASDAPVVFVPLDDRPVTLQLPLMLGEIAGRHVLTPPHPDIGAYLRPGDSDDILRWLASPVTEDANAMIVSADMIAYGGLVASRTPEVAPYMAFARLRELADLRRARPGASLDVFGTIMRLAPTGLPPLPSTAGYWAVDGTVDAIQAYANLHDPPQDAQEKAQARRLRDKIGQATLDAYLFSRTRNLDVDLFLLQLTADDAFDRLVLGQDDAGPIGVHVRDLTALNARKQLLGPAVHAWIEPGTDELGMLLLAATFARDVAWKPTVSVHYSRMGGENINDPLEFLPIDATISHLIEAVGARRTVGTADVELFVKVPDTGEQGEIRFLDAIADGVRRHVGVAVADLTFLNNPIPNKEQQRLTEELITRGSAGLIDAFSSWNTTANTVGTALAEAIAVGAGKRAHRYSALAHARFMLNRYIDDYAFHQFVRPALNSELRANGIDPTFLPFPVLKNVSRENSDALRRYARWLSAMVYPQYRTADMTITLPWQRTFETQINIEFSDPLEKFLPSPSPVAVPR
jgi:Protein of unknown function (DUF4127)